AWRPRPAPDTDQVTSPLTALATDSGPDARLTRNRRATPCEVAGQSISPGPTCVRAPHRRAVVRSPAGSGCAEWLRPRSARTTARRCGARTQVGPGEMRSEEHTSELQSR